MSRNVHHHWFDPLSDGPDLTDRFPEIPSSARLRLIHLAAKQQCLGVSEPSEPYITRQPRGAS
jgi:hypothetical protein